MERDRSAPVGASDHNLPRVSFPSAPTSRRARFARALDGLGLLDRFLWVRKKVRYPALTVLTYHRVAEEERELDPGVVEARPGAFADQLEAIKAHCTVVSLDDVLRFRRGRPLPPNPVLLTFDDGYADNYDVVLPILRKASATATFFVPTAYPDAGQLFWWDRVALIMRRCSKPVVELSYPWPMRLTPMADPITAAHAVCKAIKRVTGVDVSRTFEELERATGVHLDPAEEREIAGRTIMSWARIRSLRAAGMDVQSHSHSHRVLNTLSPAEVTSDLRRSKEMLRDMVGETAHTVAYPVGYLLDATLRQATADAGFDIGFTNNTGVCMTTAFDPLNLPRLSLDREHVGSLYKLLLLMGHPAHPATADSGRTP